MTESMEDRRARGPSYIAALTLTILLPACTTFGPGGPPGPQPGGDVLAAVPDAFPAPGTAPNRQEPEGTPAPDWRDFFADPGLRALIETALAGNQELAILEQEIAVLRNEARARSGEYLPFVDLRAGAGVDKVGEFTREGAVEQNLDLAEGEPFPEPLRDFVLSADVSWEIDVWKRLRNARKAAVLRFLASREGRNFAVTHLVAEVARDWYELRALDGRLAILERMIRVQEDVLEAVRQQKAAARATELAVRRFEAEVQKNRSELYEVRQRITETENRLNFLAGRYPQPIERTPVDLDGIALDTLAGGVPSELLRNRPDVRRAELELAAARLDVDVARARFYPSLDLRAAVGLHSSRGAELLTSPESLAYELVGDLAVPLLNRRAIRAEYASATAEQLAALERYRRTVLNAFVEVTNRIARIRNLDQSYARKREQVATLDASVDIAGRLFRSARAEYTEVLLTQRDALESRMELVELRQRQLAARVEMYQALGGGYDRAVEDAPG
jgi:multidrug efflux system outer membrane protein